MARIGAAAIAVGAQREVRRRNAKSLRTACRSMGYVYLSYRLPKQQFSSTNQGMRIHQMAMTALIQNRLSESLSPKLSWTLVLVRTLAFSLRFRSAIR